MCWGIAKQKMNFTMASQMKAGKIAKDARSSQQTTVQKGSGGKPQVGADSLSIAKATSAPKVQSGFVGAHKGDSRTAPKNASSFTNDRQVDAGEFESNAAPSSADTAAYRTDRVGTPPPPPRSNLSPMPHFRFQGETAWAVVMQ
jgi:hypothetical protein